VIVDQGFSMPSDQSCWTTQKELSFLNELASREQLEFGRSRQGPNKVVDCARALAGYAAAFEARANWQNIDPRAISEWLARYKRGRVAQSPLMAQSAQLQAESGAEHLTYDH